MQVVREIRFFAAISVVAAVCLLVTARYAFSFVSEPLPIPSCDFYLCIDKLSVFSPVSVGAVPASGATAEPDEPVVVASRQKQAPQQAFVSVEHYLCPALAVDFFNGHRKDKKTIPLQTRDGLSFLPAFSWHIPLPDDGLSIGIFQDQRVIPGRRTGYLRAGP